MILQSISYYNQYECKEIEKILGTESMTLSAHSWWPIPGIDHMWNMKMPLRPADLREGGKGNGEAQRCQDKRKLGGGGRREPGRARSSRTDWRWGRCNAETGRWKVFTRSSHCCILQQQFLPWGSAAKSWRWHSRGVIHGPSAQQEHLPVEAWRHWCCSQEICLHVECQTCQPEWTFLVHSRLCKIG